MSWVPTSSKSERFRLTGWQSAYARVLDVTVEGLTVAVFAHELVHAYTHLGNDHDVQQWETKAFADADNKIVEGLAQFYTATISSKI